MSSNLPASDMNERLTKSKQRIADHGEVFTPNWIVEKMLDLVKEEATRVDSRFLEPACGSGNFLCAVLLRKLKFVDVKYSKSEFERNHHALFALMCIYGIELLEDNVNECRENLLLLLIDTMRLEPNSAWIAAAQKVLEANIIQGDALTLKSTNGDSIIFPEWSYIGTGKYQRRDFRFDSLTQRAGIKGTLFELFEEKDIFVPIKNYEPMNVEELAK